MTEYAFEGGKRAGTTINWSFETQTYASDASFPFSNTIDAAYQDTIRAAFARWSSVSGLTFVESPDSSTDAIRIGFGVFPSPGTVGETVYSYAAGILRPDTILRLLDPRVLPLVQTDGGWTYGTSGITLFQIVLHEIGHALGLAHTTDPATLMYPVATDLNADISAGDVQGIDTLYPLYAVRALDPMQAEGNAGLTSYHFLVTRASDPAVPLTISYSVAGAAYPGFPGTVAAVAAEFPGGVYPTGQLTFAAGSATAVLTVGVAGNTVAQPDQGFAISLGSLNPADTVTVRGSTNALILDDDGSAAISASTLGVYRFFSTLDGTHFFTANKSERNTLLATRPDLVYEGPALNAVTNPGSDPAAAPVFRFFDTVHGTHFYTASAAERDMSLQTRPDLLFEGTAFYEHTTSQAGDIPVYRFFDDRLGTHFYTSSQVEHDSVVATRSDLVDEGISFYTPTA